MTLLSAFFLSRQPSIPSVVRPQGGYCLPYQASQQPLTLEMALDLKGMPVDLRVLGIRQNDLAGQGTFSGQVRGMLEEVYADTARSPGEFAQVGPVLVNLGHVVQWQGSRLCEHPTPLSLLDKLATLPSGHKVYMPNAVIWDRRVEGIAEHSSVVMLKVGAKWCNLNHIAEIRDSKGVAPQGEKLAVQDLISVLRELGSSGNIALDCPRAESVSGKLLRLHIDTSAIFLEIKSQESAKPLLVNLAHIATIELERQPEAKEQGNAEPTAMQQQEVEVLSLNDTLSCLKGYLLSIEAPFVAVPHGPIKDITSDPLKGGYVLHTGGGAIPVAEVATLTRLGLWSSLLSLRKGFCNEGGAI